MSRPFIITGLPRSGTAWLAALCNMASGAVCFHEPTQWLNRWEGVRDLLTWKQETEPFRGVSDSIMGFRLNELRSLNARIVVVERDRRDVLESLSRLDPTWACEPYLKVLERRLNDYRGAVHRVPFSGLTQAGTVMPLLDYVMPGHGITRNKVIEMARMNIQARHDIVQRAAKKRRGDAWRILGQDVVEEINAEAV